MSDRLKERFCLDNYPFALIEVVKGMGESHAYCIARYEDIELAIQIKNYLNFKQRQLHSSRKSYMVYDIVEDMELT